MGSHPERGNLLCSLGGKCDTKGITDAFNTATGVPAAGTTDTTGGGFASPHRHYRNLASIRGSRAFCYFERAAAAGRGRRSAGVAGGRYAQGDGGISRRYHLHARPRRATLRTTDERPRDDAAANECPAAHDRRGATAPGCRVFRARVEPARHSAERTGGLAVRPGTGAGS